MDKTGFGCRRVEAMATATTHSWMARNASSGAAERSPNKTVTRDLQMGHSCTPGSTRTNATKHSEQNSCLCVRACRYARDQSWYSIEAINRAEHQIAKNEKVRSIIVGSMKRMINTGIRGVFDALVAWSCCCCERTTVECEKCERCGQVSVVATSTASVAVAGSA